MLPPNDVPAMPGSSAGMDGGPPVPAGTWAFDLDRTVVEFVARHFVVSRVRGRFPTFAGRLTVTPGAIGSTVEATADARSVDTGDPARDDHLRSPDFFDVERWPTLQLRGRVTALTGRGYQLDADLTIRDQTRPVSFDVLVQEVVDAPGGPQLTATAYAVVNRKDFGLRWNATIETGGVVVSDQVELTLELVARLEP